MVAEPQVARNLAGIVLVAEHGVPAGQDDFFILPGGHKQDRDLVRFRVLLLLRSGDFMVISPLLNALSSQSPQRRHAHT